MKSPILLLTILGMIAINVVTGGPIEDPTQTASSEIVNRNANVSDVDVHSRRKRSAKFTCSNGAGGTFRCLSNMSNRQIAESACKSLYGSCSAGTCGGFDYYYSPSTGNCGRKASGAFEFIYSNTGMHVVGQDYGGAGQSVYGNSLFVRKYHGSNSSTPDIGWTLELDFLGKANYYSSSICDEIRHAVITSAFSYSTNKGVVNGIMDKLKRRIAHRVGGYFVVVYNDVSGSDKHWGTSMCTIDDEFFRLNGFNVRVLWKNYHGRPKRRVYGSVPYSVDDKVGSIKICWGCGVWYNSYGMEVKHSRSGGQGDWNYFEII